MGRVTSFADVHRIGVLRLSFALGGEPMQVFEAISRRRSVCDVDGRSGEPKNFVRLWIAVKVFR